MIVEPQFTLPYSKDLISHVKSCTTKYKPQHQEIDDSLLDLLHYKNPKLSGPKQEKLMDMLTSYLREREERLI